MKTVGKSLRSPWKVKVLEFYTILPVWTLYSVDAQTDLNLRCMHMATCTLCWIPAQLCWCIYRILMKRSTLRTYMAQTATQKTSRRRTRRKRRNQKNRINQELKEATLGFIGPIWIVCIFLYGYSKTLPQSCKLLTSTKSFYEQLIFHAQFELSMIFYNL